MGMGGLLGQSILLGLALAIKNPATRAGLLLGAAGRSVLIFFVKFLICAGHVIEVNAA